MTSKICKKLELFPPACSQTNISIHIGIKVLIHCVICINIVINVHIYTVICIHNL